MTTLLRWGFVVLLAAHGVAHLPGFAVSWRLLASPELPYHTTLWSGRFDIGDSGIRIVGLLWLIVGMGFVAGAILLASRWRWAFALVACIALVSLLLGLAEWPFARVGVALNALIVAMVPLVALASWRSETTALVSAMSADRSAADARTSDRLVGTGGPVGASPAAVVSGPRQEPAFALASVPPIVARYFARALGDAPRGASGAVFTQDAEMMIGDTWRPLSATQYVSAVPAGFVWDARIAMAPGISVHVRDSYLRGHGSMEVALAAVVPMVSQHGRPELDAGALHRYLAELVWMPSGLLPGVSVRWEPIDDRSARVVRVDGQTTVALDFRFNAEADVEEIFTTSRFAEHDGEYALEPWLVRCRDYTVFDGVRVPSYCEVSWLKPDGPAPYWRGRLTSARYEFAAHGGGSDHRGERATHQK